MTRTKNAEKKVRKILIVEDEGDMCLLLEILLNGKELTADHVKSLAAAEAYLQSEESELVVLDNRLPDGFGLDFINFLKTKYPAIKIILISGVDAAAEDIALQNGADCFLKKPFSRTQLYDSIHNLLN